MVAVCVAVKRRQVRLGKGAEKIGWHQRLNVCVCVCCGHRDTRHCVYK